MGHPLGRFLAKLYPNGSRVDELGLSERTVILFTGDNGTHPTIWWQLNDREIREGKGQMTDAGTRVPLVVRWPGTVATGQVTDALIDFSDFLPTVLVAGGLPVPTGLDGRSFSGLLAGDDEYRPRDWIHVYYCPRPEKSRPQRFVRDQRFKLYGDGRFIDVAADVNERNPLTGPLTGAASEAQTKLKRALASMPAEGQSLLKFVP